MDLKEADKFEACVEKWWDPKSTLATLRKMNKVRIPFLIDSLKKVNSLKDVEDDKKPLNGFNILDVGCGCGFLSEELSRLGAKVTGIDGVEKLIEAAKAHAALDDQIKNLTYIAEPIQSYSKENAGKFDVVILSEVLEHIVNKEEAIESVVKCAKPGGSIIITTATKTFLSKILTIYLLEYIVGAIGKGVHDIEMYITPEDVQNMLETNGCVVKDVKGIFFNFFTGNWSIVPFTTFYMLHAVKNA